MQDLTSFRAFHALYLNQSLTAAAKVLNQPKSTLSRRLNQLENDMGQSLMIRSGNRIVITKAGEIFFEYCDKILSLADEGINAVQDLNNQVSGEINLVANVNLIRGWLSPLLDEFLGKNPKLSMRVVSQYTPSVSPFEPDLIFWVGDLPGLHWRKEVLGCWGCSFFAAPSYLRHAPELNHPSDLENHICIDYMDNNDDEGTTLNHPDQPDFFLKKSQSRLQSDSAILQLDAIARGRGIGLLPQRLYNNFIKAHPGKLVPCLNGWSSVPKNVYCYFPPGRQPRRVIEFMNRVRKHIPENWRA